MLLATALALLITGCAQQTFTVQNKPAAVAPKETITHHFFVSGIGQKKLSMQPKICGGAENVVKTETPANIRKWIARFYYFRHLYSAGSARGHHTFIWAYQLLWATLSPYRSLTYRPSCFGIVISLSEGEIIPFSGVCQSGEAALSTPEAVASRTDWQTALMCNRRRPAATSSRRALRSHIS